MPLAAFKAASDSTTTVPELTFTVPEITVFEPEAKVTVPVAGVVLMSKVPLTSKLPATVAFSPVNEPLAEPATTPKASASMFRSTAAILLVPSPLIKSKPPSPIVKFSALTVAVLVEAAVKVS